MGHDHHHHLATADAGKKHSRALLAVVALTLGFAAIEAAGGWWTHSLALLADAGHMLSDSLALALAWLAQSLARRPVSARYSYGLGRLEPFAALVNAVLMLAVIGGIVWEALHRFAQPEPVRGGWMLLIAVCGFAVNLLAARLLWHDHGNLNMRGALLHVLGDLLGSAAAIIAAVVILWTGWQAIDPLLSLLVAGLILFSTVRLLFESSHVLLEGTPAHLDLQQVGQALAGVGGVTAVHDLHVWQLDSQRVALSAHLSVETLDAWPRLLASCRNLLQQQFGIAHVTLQPETPLQLKQYADAIPITRVAGDGHAHNHVAHGHHHH